MSGSSFNADEFLARLTETTKANLTNSQFGVSELAREMGMSRSNLHLRVKKITEKSVSQFINQVRLEKAMELLKQESLIVSEAAFESGFHSVTYFIKCFREYYGFPPGEVGKNSPDLKKFTKQGSDKRSKFQLGYDNFLKSKKNRMLPFGVILIVGFFFLYKLIGEDSPIPKANGLTFGPSIAVLPFKNLNNDTTYEYFSIGVAEAINRHLSHIGNLKVISLTSTDRYRESVKSAREIGLELNVSSLLEGSFQRHKNFFRLEVRLIDVDTEGQLWAENYDRELNNIFHTQSEIARQIVLALKNTLSVEEINVLNFQLTENAEAYDLYMKGLYENHTQTRSGNNRAIEYYQQAIALDSNYALPYAGIAGSMIIKASVFIAELSTKEAMDLAKPYIDKALLLDPELPEAHLYNGFYLLHNNWDFEGAEQAYKKSLIAENAVALDLYSYLLNFTRRHEEALAISQTLQQKHPYYPSNTIAFPLFYLGRYAEAEEFALSMMKLFNNYETLETYGFIKLNTNNYEEAIRIFQQIFEIENIRYPRILGWMGAAFARAGQQKKALENIEELKANLYGSNAGAPAFYIAVIYSAMGDEVSALKYLQIAVNGREMEVPWLISEPQFFSLHDNPAFIELAVKVGFNWPY